MAKRSLAEQLEEGVEGIVSRRQKPLPELDPRGADLLRVAVDLRDLPREEFRSRLAARLEGRKTMTSASVESVESVESRPSVPAVREGFHTITPYLVAA